jgi:DUF438 domain-containing protein
MSELINNSQQRLEDLTDFALGLLRSGEGRNLFDKHRTLIETVTPVEAMQVLDKMLADGLSVETVKAAVGKIINSFYKSLSSQHWEKPNDYHFLTFLMRENREAEKIMAEIKLVTKLLFNSSDPAFSKHSFRLLQLVDRLKLYELHYIKKENILFSYIEKVFPQYRCLQLMWSFHDDFRKSIKSLQQMLTLGNPDKTLLNKELGNLFFVVLPVIFREEQIVFPVAYRAIPASEWDEMMRQSREIGWCYIDGPPAEMLKMPSCTDIGNRVNMGSGFLSPEQLTLIFSHLPVDITFVDENDEVCFFSDVKDRIFPRSKAIIGRKVQNCHPPESVHIVNEIVEAFRHGRKEYADFWIQFRERFILIRYFALRDAQGTYRGTIEVTQDATAIRDLKGERRLLDWKESPTS